MVAVVESMSSKDLLFGATVEVLGEYCLQHFRSQEENLLAEIQEVYQDSAAAAHDDQTVESARIERPSA